MWVSWMMARQVVIELLLVALGFAAPAVSFFLLTAWFLDYAPRMDDALAYLVGRLLRILVLAFGLWMAIETLDLRAVSGRTSGRSQVPESARVLEETHPTGSEADHPDRGEAEDRVARWGATLADP